MYQKIKTIISNSIIVPILLVYECKKVIVILSNKIENFEQNLYNKNHRDII